METLRDRIFRRVAAILSSPVGSWLIFVIPYRWVIFIAGMVLVHYCQMPGVFLILITGVFPVKASAEEEKSRPFWLYHILFFAPQFSLFMWTVREAQPYLDGLASKLWNQGPLLAISILAIRRGILNWMKWREKRASPPPSASEDSLATA